MSRLSDPSICPDCRAALENRRCTSCGLNLVGQPAADLWQHLLDADVLIEQIRTASSTLAWEAVSVPRSAPSVPEPAITSSLPTAPALPQPRPTQVRVPNRSVPFVLLGLGALCLLVAAVVFVAVAWSSLGLGAKAAILLAVTAGFGATAVVLSRRGLRGAAETFWLIVLTMLAIDLTAGWAADLAGLDGLDLRHLIALIGGVSVVVSVAVTVWVAATPLHRLAVPVLATAGGTFLVTLGEAWTHPDHAAASAVAVPVVLGFAALLAFLRPNVLRDSAIAVGAVGIVSWVVLLGTGLDRAAEVSRYTWWHDLDCWPLLAASVYAAAVTAFRHLPDAARMVAAAGSLIAAGLFVVGPGGRDNLSLIVLVGIAVGLAAVSAQGPRTWSVPAAILSVPALLVGGGTLLYRPLTSVFTLDQVLDNGLGRRLLTDSPFTDPWTAVLIAVSVVASLGALVRPLTDLGRTDALVGWLAIAPSVLALGGATMLLESEPTLLRALLSWAAVLVLAVLGAVAVRAHGQLLALIALVLGYLVCVGLCLAAPSHLGSAALATTIALVAAVAYLRASPEHLDGAALPLLAILGVGTSGVAAAHAPYLLGGGADAAGLAAVLLAVALGLAARPVSRNPHGRGVLEASALVLGLAAVLLPNDPAHAALVLTLLGSGVALFSLIHPDRDEFSWVAVGLLAVATGYRIGEDLTSPELYALPAAALLLAVGAARLRAEPELSSFRALGSGLTLAFGPTLVLALADPVSLRGVLVAVAGLLALAIGIGWHWTAPFAAGSVVVALLVVRHLGPVAEALPRWISLGGVGVALLLVGVTWEARRQNVAVASRYLTALR